jgi:DNA gyrase subunit A
VVAAAMALIDDPTATVRDLMKHVPGPDFPTGGRLLSTPDEIREIYETGQGTLRVCATWREEKDSRRRLIVLDSIPYGQNKARLIERIGDEVRLKRLPQVNDVRDESTEIVRIAIELKQGASAADVMAFLFKRTPLQTTWPVNLTALVPGSRVDVATPARLDLKAILQHWIDFRLETVRRRFEHDLAEIRERIHILEGFQAIFDLLDEAIRIIRASEGRRDASEKLMERVSLSEVQTDAILELKLYRLARLEIQLIIDELQEKHAEAHRIELILGSRKELVKRVRSELDELRTLYADERRTVIGDHEQELTFDEDAYIVREEVWVVVTREGWIKRQSSLSDVAKIRVREGDEPAWVIRTSTASTLTIFGSSGAAFVLRVDAITATTGYGDPLSKMFAREDGDRVVGVVSHDPRNRVPAETVQPAEEGDPPGPWGVALTEGGRVLRFGLSAHEDISTRNGRRYARLEEGDAVFGVHACGGAEHVCVATRQGRAAVFPVSDVGILKAPGKGVTGIKLRDEDRVMAFDLARSKTEGITVITALGREVFVSPGERSFADTPRGGRGKVILQRGTIDTWVRSGPVIQGDRTPTAEADSAPEGSDS